MKPNQHSPKVGLNSLKSTRLFPLLLCSLNANAAPSGFISFQVPFWTQYKWHIIGIIALCIVEALLILALLIQRSRQSRDVTELERRAGNLLSGQAARPHRHTSRRSQHRPAEVSEVGSTSSQGSLSRDWRRRGRKDDLTDSVMLKSKGRSKPAQQSPLE